jgi:hypothetical protein
MEKLENIEDIKKKYISGEPLTTNQLQEMGKAYAIRKSKELSPEEKTALEYYFIGNTKVDSWCKTFGISKLEYKKNRKNYLKEINRFWSHNSIKEELKKLSQQSLSDVEDRKRRIADFLEEGIKLDVTKFIDDNGQIDILKIKKSPKKIRRLIQDIKFNGNTGCLEIKSVDKKSFIREYARLLGLNEPEKTENKTFIYKREEITVNAEVKKLLEMQSNPEFKKITEHNRNFKELEFKREIEGI